MGRKTKKSKAGAKAASRKRKKGVSHDCASCGYLSFAWCRILNVPTTCVVPQATLATPPRVVASA